MRNVKKGGAPPPPPPSPPKYINSSHVNEVMEKFGHGRTDDELYLVFINAHVGPKEVM